MRRRRRRGAVAGERGSAAIEVALWAPAIVLALLAIYWTGRYVTAEFAVSEVARNAARAVSIAPDAATAQANAMTAAQESLASQDLRCLSLIVDVDVSGFATPLGLPANARVDVSCTVDDSDLVWPGIPGNPTLTGDAVSPLDAYRSR